MENLRVTTPMAESKGEDGLNTKRTLNLSNIFDPPPPQHPDGTPGISEPVVSMNLLIGACLAIGGNLLISVSMNVQKYSLTKIQQRREARGEEVSDNYDYLKSWLWWSGILLMITGEGGNFLAYGFGPASVVAPLGTTTVVD
nr:NIPA-like protein 2 [Lytechinus pictus]